jgi:hypothetical protein
MSQWCHVPLVGCRMRDANLNQKIALIIPLVWCCINSFSFLGPSQPQSWLFPHRLSPATSAGSDGHRPRAARDRIPGRGGWHSGRLTELWLIIGAMVSVFPLSGDQITKDNQSEKPPSQYSDSHRAASDTITRFEGICTYSTRFNPVSLGTRDDR